MVFLFMDGIVEVACLLDCSLICIAYVCRFSRVFGIGVFVFIFLLPFYSVISVE